MTDKTAARVFEGIVVQVLDYVPPKKTDAPPRRKRGAEPLRDSGALQSRPSPDARTGFWREGRRNPTPFKNSDDY